MKVLVTGAAGFIGSHVALALLSRGENVIGLDNLNDYYDVNLKQARLDRIAARAAESASKQARSSIGEAAIGNGSFVFHHAFHPAP